MKNLITFRISILLFVLFSKLSFAQLPAWEELRTDTKIGDEKTKSIENATTWVDSEQNLWVLGGELTSEDDLKKHSNDLWKFDSKTNSWDIILSKTDENQSQFPPTRKEATTWSDPKGMLWLFGGKNEENEFLNDLWRYIIEKNIWEQIPKNPDNKEIIWPSVRGESAKWIDIDRNLWLFGGREASTERNYYGFQNDLWCYNIEKNVWKKIELIVNENKELAVPDPRIQSACFISVENELILFGGLGESKTRRYFGGYFDIWIYNIKENIWREIMPERLDDRVDFYQKDYGISGIENNLSRPGFRIKPSFWQDKEGFCWFYGGQTIITSEKVFVEPYIWRLSLKSYLWTVFPIENDIKYINPQAIFENFEGKLTILAPNIIDERAQITTTNSLYILNDFKK